MICLMGADEFLLLSRNPPMLSRENFVGNEKTLISELCSNDVNVNGSVFEERSF